MNIEELKRFQHERQVVKGYLDSHLEPDKNGKGWICPFCGNGSGNSSSGKGEGLTISSKNNISCYSQCNETWDLIGFIAKQHHLDLKADFKQICQLVANELGVILDESSSWNSVNNNINYKNAINDKSKQVSLKSKKTDQQNKIDKEKYSQIIKEAQKNLESKEAVEYLKSRGISLATAKKLELGYLPKHYFVKAKNYLGGILYPKGLSKGAESYGVRSIDGKYHDKSKKNGGLPINYQSYISEDNNKPIFIVEGLFDALSILEVGFEAIALDGKAGKELIRIVKEKNITNPLILALDNDESGIDATLGKDGKAGLFEKLKEAGADVYISTFLDEKGLKDPNDYLMKDKEEFKIVLEEASSNYKEKDPHFKRKKEEYFKNFNDNEKESFNGLVSPSVITEEIPTGFKQLDKQLDGGLYEGLYVLGAVSSLGKTAFCLQLADQIASSGNDVLFYSLEMAKPELIARSISRNTAIIGENKGNESESFLTVRDILNPKKFNQLNNKSKRLYNISSKKYFEETGKHLIIFEALGTMSVDQIKQDVINHIKYTNNKPIVFIDYLQLLVQSEEKGLRTDKQIIDANVLKLKQLSRDYKIPIFAISSFNRGSYNIPASMEAFKESGAIEYSSDVLLSLERIRKRDIKEDSLDEIKEEERITGIKNISLKVLKNRNGIANIKIPFEFEARFNYFKEKLEQNKNKKINFFE